MGAVDVGDVDAGPLVHGPLLAVDHRPGLLGVIGHQGKRSRIAGRGPGGRFHAVPRPVEVERLGNAGIGLAGAQDGDVFLKFGFGVVELPLVAGEEIAIVLKFYVEIGFGGMQEVALVEVFDQRL